MNQKDLFTRRQGLHEICTVPDKIISVQDHLLSATNGRMNE